jgi:N-acetylmuramoyl-L-alanine amidase
MPHALDRSSWHKALAMLVAASAILLAIVTTQPAAAMPAPREQAQAAPKPLAGKTIVIDPGHQLGNSRHPAQINRLVNAGGFMKPCNTTGTATNGGFPEATLNWDVAVLLRARLRAEGATVYLTRYTNSLSRWGPCVDVRGRTGNRVHADAAISIHGDGAPSQYHGFFVIMPGHRAGWTNDIYTSSHQLGAAVHGGLVTWDVTVANDYGGKGYSTRTDLGTLNWSNVPIVMVELGNMRNRIDAGHMTSPAYRNYRYARGLALGLTRYVTRH